MEKCMKKNVVFLIVIFSVINFGFSLLTKFTKKNNIRQDVLPNMVVIKLKSDAKTKLSKESAVKKSFDQLLSAFGTAKMEKVFINHDNQESNGITVDLSNIYYINYTKDIAPEKVAEILGKSELIEYAEPKRIRHLCYTPNDAQYLTQWSLYQIQMEKAWEISKGSTSVVIGIIDTGIDWTHPDLAANIWNNYDEIAGNGMDDDHNGYIDDVRGWDFGGLGNGNNPTPDNDPNEDRADHGTHVAGIASACTNNGIGIAGIGFNCKLMPVKVTQDNRRPDGPPSVIFGSEGIVYAADNGANIINCSWGGGGFSRYENDAVQYATQKGALVVAAAGNDGLYQTVFTPASYDNVLAVASTGGGDFKSDFSNYGPYVGVSAPGTNIVSTWFKGEYTWESGTSMACPCAAGVAALVKSKFPNYTPNQVREKVRVTADKLDTINTRYVGFLGGGRVNAYNALTMSSPAIRILKYYLDDTTKGNGNGILEPGEKVMVKMEFENFLDNTSGLKISLTSKNANIKVNSGDLSLGKVNTLQKVNNFQSPFEIEVGSNVPYDMEAVFSVSFKDGSYDDNQQFSVSFNPSYTLLSSSNIDVTVCSQGNLGYIDSPDNTRGSGLVYKNYNDIMFEGSLMFGNVRTNISNCARNDETDSEKDEHFKIIKAISFSKTANADDEGYTVFSDDLNPNKYNITTTLRTYSYRTDPYGNFILLNYTFKNNNSVAINNLYTGLFFDWDISSDDNGNDDISMYDPNYKIGYQYDSRGLNKTFIGVTMLNNTDKINYYPIINGDINSWQIYDGFSTSEKFTGLSSGIYKTSSVGPDDLSMVMSAGPLNIPPGESVNVTFAILAGESLGDLQAASLKAQEKFKIIKVSTPALVEIPKAFDLYQNYPNPFNPATSIRYNLEKTGNVEIKIFDTKGSMVNRICRQNLSAGEHSESLNLSFYSSGIYFYQIQVYDSKRTLLYEKTKKMTLLK
jgi:serine protease